MYDTVYVIEGKFAASLGHRGKYAGLKPSEALRYSAASRYVLHSLAESLGLL